ncbi:RNA polymerase sigma factor [Dyadobacter sp. CY326]|uniref:RNA polymerase sigma factor n=1 Tax=Dyadobacter sp. CY326 TaxID=2907300 RepID=UPI001F379672|nr:sigma-70 family RNA polymerase sigma factor [Dyadobacter sp. CY326]MCE7066082.1 sigma-70 family RNA polymerase sigma factor [Dyadobacter sp. CY326]
MRFLNVFKANNTAPLSEAQQLAAYRRSGDVGALGALYQPYMEMVFAICYKYLKEEDDCKDAVMQIFEKLVVELRTHEVDNFKSWLHSVTRNFCLMQLRTQRSYANVSALDADEEILQLAATEPEMHSLAENRFNALEHCMKTLTREQRISVELFYLEEKCYKEISEATGFEAGKVKSYIQNGKRNLKICMDKNG